MQRVVVLLSALVQMVLVTWLWTMLGLNWNKKRCIILFVMLSSLVTFILFPQLSMSENYLRYLMYLSIIFIAKLSFKLSFKRTIYDLYIIFIILYVVQSTQLVIYRAIFSNNTLSEQNFDSLIDVIIVNSNFFIFVLLCYCSKKVIRIILKYKNILEETSMIYINIGLTIIFIQAVRDLYPQFVWDHLFVFCAVTWMLFFFNFLEMKRNVELVEQKKAIQIYQQYYPIVSRMIEEAKQKHHEFKNHLNTIYGIIQMDKQQGGEDALKYIQAIRNISGDTCFLLKIKNRIIAAVLFNKIYEAEEKGILFECDINKIPKYPMSDPEFVEVLSNLLDNAFEAVSENLNAKKHVLLAMYQNKKGVFLDVRNNGRPIVAEEISKIFKPNYSTKGIERGFGLYNVKAIMEQRAGNIEVSYEGGYTIFKVGFDSDYTSHS